MKKVLAVIAILLVAVLALVGCEGIKGGEALSPDGGYNSSNGSFNEIIENPFLDPTVNPEISFGLSVSKASYNWVKRAINEGNANIDPNSVRMEDLVNNFNYSYKAPEKGLAVGSAMIDCPWNKGSKLMAVNVKAEEVKEIDKRNNLVFLIDTSGSMMGEDRLSLVKETLNILLTQLKDDDVISIVTYAGSDKVLLNGTKGSEKARIKAVIEDLSASGSTNGSGAIQRAYEIATSNFIAEGNNQVILCTDGDFNVGISDPKRLGEFISEKRDTGVFLSVFGYGVGNTGFALMEELAKNGNGVQHYIADENDARLAMTKGLSGMLNIVAKDAKTQVRFDAEKVAKYRLIGYENLLMSPDDFQNEGKDSTEIGAGHTVTAVFEVVLRENVLATDNIAKATIKYKDVNNEQMTDVTCDIKGEVVTNNEDMKFIACVVEFGLILRKSGYRADASLDAVIRRLNDLPSVVNDDARSEFKNLVVRYKALTSNSSGNYFE